MHDARLIAAMKAGVTDFARYRNALPHIPSGYTRTLLKKAADFELVAMRWAGGSMSPIHDHGRSRCWVVVLEGSLHVESFDRLDDGTTEFARLGPAQAQTLHAGGLDYRLTWRELHRVRNASPASAYSLQVYAAAQDEYIVVDETTNRCSSVSAKYDSIFSL